MGEALFWGLVGSSSLILGGVLSLVVPVSRRTLGLVMAFGAGVLISAVAYELVQEAFDTSAGSGDLGLGLVAGAIVFYAGDEVIDRLGGDGRKSASGVQSGGAALAIVLGIVLDGIPESAVLGLTVLSGEVSVAVLVAVFLSNLPEAVAATTGLRSAGWPGARLLALWSIVTAVSGLAALAGYAILDGASDGAVAFVLSFAAGAILTMLADTMMPEAYRYGGRLVGLATTVGFGTAFAVSSME